MNEDVFEGKWLQLRGRIKEFWGDLTDDELDQIEGRRDRLAGKLQEKYGYSYQQADAEIDRFLRDIDASL